jgi:hypothetical protein
VKTTHHLYKHIFRPHLIQCGTLHSYNLTISGPNLNIDFDYFGAFNWWLLILYVQLYILILTVVVLLFF